MNAQIARYQEIERRGLLDQLPIEKQELWAEIKRRGLDREQPKPDNYSALDKAIYTARAAGEGATFGLGDLVGAHMDVLASDAAGITHGKDWSDRAKSAKDLMLHTFVPGASLTSDRFGKGRRAFVREQKAFAEEHPVLNFAGEMAGGALTAGVGAGGKVAQAGQAGLKALAKEGAREGTKFGIAYGAGSGLTEDEKKLSVANALKGAAAGGVGGAVLGAALPVGIAGVLSGTGKGAGKIASYFKNKEINNLLNANKALVEQSVKEGVPLLDIADKPIMGVAEGANLISPKAEQVFSVYGKERLAGQHPKIIEKLGEYFGKKGSHQQLAELNDEVQQGSKALYDKAIYQVDKAGNILLDNAGKPVSKVLPELEKLNKYELDYVGKVYGTKGLEYEVSGLPQNDMRILNYAKQLMDDDIQRLINQGHNNQARILAEKRASFIEKIDKANPEYKTARAFFERGKRAEDALNAGKTALKGERSNLVYDFNQLTPEEKAFYIKGVGNALEELSNTNAEGGNIAHRIFGAETRRRLSELGIKNYADLEKFALSESQAAANINKLLGGSPTTNRLAKLVQFAMRPYRTAKRYLIEGALKSVSADPEVTAKLLTDPEFLAQMYGKTISKNASKSVKQALNAEKATGSISEALMNKIKEKGGFAWKDLPKKEQKRILDIIKAEQGQIENGYSEVLNNPLKGTRAGKDDVLAALQPDEFKTFFINRGPAIKDSEGNIVVRGPKVYEETGSEGFGFSKIIFDKKLSVDEMSQLPKIVREYEPILENGDKVYRVPKDNTHNYRIVFKDNPEGKSRLITMGPERISKSKPKKLSTKKEVAIPNTAFAGSNSDTILAESAPNVRNIFSDTTTQGSATSTNSIAQKGQNVKGIKQIINSEGNPVATTEEGTKNFGKFFKGSKVVDENGNPLVVYHGTKGNFDVFKSSEDGALGQGMYFVSSKEFAKGHANGGNVMPVYLNMKKPYIADGPVSGNSAEFTAKLKSQGYDGIIHPGNGFYVVFKPNQIKSVYNKGTFDPKSNNIYKALIGGLGISQILKSKENK